MQQPTGEITYRVGYIFLYIYLEVWDKPKKNWTKKETIFYTANRLIVENTTFRCILFPKYFQCIFCTQEILVVNGCIKCNETNALNTSFTCKKNAMKPLL